MEQNAAAPPPAPEASAPAGAGSAVAIPGAPTPAAAPSSPSYDFNGLGIPAAQQPAFDDFGRSMHPAGVRESIAKSAASWILEAGKKEPLALGDIVPAHEYQIDHSFPV